MGNSLNTLAAIIFGIIAGVLVLIGILSLYLTIEQEIGNSYVQLQILGFIWAIAGVFVFLTVFFYKKIHRHYEQTTSPQQKAKEKKQLLTIVLPIAGIIGVFLIFSGGIATGEFCFSSNTYPTIKGTDGDDYLIGTEGNDVIIGKKGNDFIDGRGGNDIICGHEGDDHIIGGTGNDEIWGNEGDDLLEGSEGDDRIFGHQGKDQIDGGNGNDSCFTGGKEDIVENCEIT